MDGNRMIEIHTSGTFELLQLLVSLKCAPFITSALTNASP